MANLKTISFEIDSQNTKLCDPLLNRYVFPILQKSTEDRSLAQGAVARKRLSPQEELEIILNFGSSKSIHIPRQQNNRVTQGSAGTITTTMSQKDKENVERLLEFGTGACGYAIHGENVSILVLIEDYRYLKRNGRHRRIKETV